LASGAGPIAASFVFPVVAGATGGMAGRAYEHLRTAALRASNDRDVLTAEMIDLEWRLRPGDRHVCALVVDVAGSTKMKAGADPLVVEMCFREYQNWVGATAVAHGGEVASRAGDGAVLAFEREDDAIAAGLALQAGLARFNAESNRLDNPFRLRIGIHCGEIAGDLAEVEYTGVIDGAAHVESMAPIGGVAVTATAAHRAHGWRFSPIGQQFQGNEVLVVLGPSQLRNEPVQPAV
jgi:class 3 adenylate cyclase